MKKRLSPRHNQITSKTSDIFNKKADQVSVFLANYSSQLNSTTDSNGIVLIRWS